MTKEELKAHFRIVTNGAKFKVQKRHVISVCGYTIFGWWIDVTNTYDEKIACTLYIDVTCEIMAETSTDWREI